DYGPERYCNERGCFAKDDVYKALIEVGSFKVIGPSRLGDRLVIEYSARGFESAFRRMDTQCARGRIGTWLE
ncbi:MAG TPA: hypothetical protein VEC58_09225, partial [Roseiarcus sp.]|nr:hypothetical protein [Roseiarcus sp.]